MATEQLIGEHWFTFNRHDNGGEALTLHTKIYHNGDPGEQGVFYNHELSLQSYGNSASFHLAGVNLTPEILRQLADEIEAAKNQGLLVV
jgi:hypothetical protein